MPFRSIEDPAKLRRVLEATLLIEADLDLASLLNHIVVEAVSMTGARYGALGVLDEARTGLAEFITVGIDDETKRSIGPLPVGRGVLGRLITHPEPLRLPDLSAHPDSFGFPPNHPPMTSFLGVPIRARDEIYGNLYLTEKIGWTEFTSDDEALIGALALAAGIAVENARLHERVHEMAVNDERDRLARDLHDTVIQRLFAIGLSLQSIASNPSREGLAERLDQSVADIDDTIRQVRSSIFELGLRDSTPSLRGGVVVLLRELRPIVGFEIRCTFDGPVDTAISDSVSEHVLAVVREAVTNIAKHADASSAEVTITVDERECVLRITDNGKGFDADRTEVGGLGLHNLRRRAEKLHGELDVREAVPAGAELVWRVPLSG